MDTRRFAVIPTQDVPGPVLDVADATLKACELILGIPAPRLVWARQNRTMPRGRFDWSSDGRHRILLQVPAGMTVRDLATMVLILLHELKHHHQAASGWSMSAREEPGQEADADAFMQKTAEALMQVMKKEDATATLAELKGMLR